MKSSINRKKNILKAFSVISSMTFLSRITGYVRDAFIAAFTGASFYSDAFFVAFRIPNMFRRLLGEGALTPAIVPVATELLEKDEKDCKEGIKSIIAASALTVTIVTILGIIFSPVLVKLMAYGFTKNELTYSLTVNLNRLMFPYLFFMSMVAVYMALLNARHHFFAPSFSPVFLNLSMIFSIIAFRYFFKIPVFALAYGVLLGGVLQLLFQIPFLKQEGVPFLPGTKIKTSATLSVFHMLIPSMFGLAITQINIMVDTFVASFLKEGTVSYLYYADRLLELPISLFVVSFATAILPSVSQHAVLGNKANIRENFSKTLIYALFLIIPSLFFMLCLGKPALSVLFQRKAFDMEALTGTYYALIGYSLGLPFFTFNRLITPLFYAHQNTRLPVKAGFFAMLTNIAMDVVLMPLGAFGLSAATSISAAVNGFFLYTLFRKEFYLLGIKNVYEISVKLLFAAFFAAVPVYILTIHFSYDDKLFIKIAYLLLLAATYISLLAIFMILLKVNEVKDVWNILKKRLLKQ